MFIELSQNQVYLHVEGCHYSVFRMIYYRLRRYFQSILSHSSVTGMYVVSMNIIILKGNCRAEIHISDILE